MKFTVWRSRCHGEGFDSFYLQRARLARRIKITGDETWNVSEFTENDDEKEYHSVSVNGNLLSFKTSDYKTGLRGINTVYIEKYWSYCADSIIEQLFVLRPDFMKLKPGMYGHKLLIVEYQNKVHHLKLPYCCSSCTAFEASDSSSGALRIKSQIQSLMNNSGITCDNQIWKIKDSKQNGNGYLILSTK